MSVRTNYIDPDFALINGAATYLTLAGDTGSRPHDVSVELPAAWKTVVSPLQDVPGGSSRQFRAPDFDTLVDSPMVAGNPAIYPFTVRGVTHYLVDIGEGGIWDGAKTVADVQKIVETAAAFWGAVPYDKYVFFNLIVQAIRRARAQERLHAHGEPLGRSHEARLRRVARPREPRVLPRLEREAPPAGGARAVRLRAREPHADAVGGRRPDRLLRLADCRPLRRDHAAGVPREPQRSHQRASDDAGTPVDAGRAGVAGRVDSLLPSRRELAERLDQLLHQGRDRRPAPRSRDSPSHEQREVAGRRDAGGVGEILGRARLHAPRSSARSSPKSPATICPRGCTARSTPPRSSTTPRSQPSASSSRRMSPIPRARGSGCRRPTRRSATTTVASWSRRSAATRPPKRPA